LAETKALIGKVSLTIRDEPGYEAGKSVFGGFVTIPLPTGDLKLYASTFWWVAITVVATWILLRSRAGNWIFAVGGAQQSARQVGVPVARTKIALFMTTAGAGWLVGMLLLFT